MSNIYKNRKAPNAMEEEKIRADLLPSLMYLAEEAQKAGLDDVFTVLNKAVSDIHSIMKINKVMH